MSRWVNTFYSDYHRDGFYDGEEKYDSEEEAKQYIIDNKIGNCTGQKEIEKKEAGASLIKINGKEFMLNSEEQNFFTSTGNLKRIKEADGPDYIEIRDKMIGNGDEPLYKSCCPPETETPPHYL